MKTASFAVGMAALVVLVACKEGGESSAEAAASDGSPAASSSDVIAEPVLGEATLGVPPSATAGARVDAAWTGPGNMTDYIDIVPRGETATRGEIAYTYLRDSQDGRVSVRAPTTAGEYDVRYVLDLGSTREVKARAPLTVTAPQAALSFPASAGGGEPVRVQWTGPAGDGDYIDIVTAGSTEVSGELDYAYAREGSPAALTAPGASGAYDVRYVLEGPGGRKVVSTGRLSVTTPGATLQAPDSVVGGGVIAVTWTGPRREGDYVDLVPKGYELTSGELDYFYTARAGASELTAPVSAGEFEIRYILEAPGGRIVLARRPVSVR